MSDTDQRPPIAQQVEAHLARLRDFGASKGAPALDRMVLAWIGRGMLADRWAKLDQAGRTDAEKVRLSKVFVDTPRLGAPERSRGFVAEQLMTPALTLANPRRTTTSEYWRSAIASQRRIAVSSALSAQIVLIDEPEAGLHPQWLARFKPGVLLVGGPGQGKSTITQFFCQVHRSWWCAGSIDEVHAAESQVIREDIADRLPEPHELMLPVRIDLARLLARLQGGTTSVLMHLHEEIGLPSTASAETLGEALRSVPLLVVFDGLDELPASGGRAQVLSAIDAFLDGLLGTSGRLIVATRPQGYAREFGQLTEWTIAPWTISTARSYAGRLLAQRYPDQPEERAQHEERIDEACRDESTARLMTTPLQVTMMAALVTYLGRPPRERWKLFLEYYRLIVAREGRKPGLAHDLLQRSERVVREIHQHVAILLQARGEATGASPYLSRDDLAGIARARLEREGFAEEARERLVGQIVEVATDRLVFLVQPVEGSFGFEVRSLQEFFAAGALTMGDDDVIVERLAEVARSPSWSNVVVFAVGRAMEEFSPQMQERLTTGMCDFVDSPGDQPLDGIGGCGAELAMKLLRDGAVLAVPRVARPLLERALRALELPPDELHDRLVAVCAEREIDEVIGSRAALISRLTSGPTLTHWRMLLVLAEFVPTARDVVVEQWPESKYEHAKIFDAVMVRPSSHLWFAEWVLSRLEQFDPRLAQESRGFSRLMEASDVPASARVLALCGAPSPDEGLDPKPSRESVGVSIEFHAIPAENETALPDELLIRLRGQTAWRPVVEMVSFVRSPSRETLADVLVAEADGWEGGARMGPDWGPWIIHGILRLAADPTALRAQADRVRNGEMGDTSDWRAAERRWMNQGLITDDIQAWIEAGPFDRMIANRGSPGAWSYSTSLRKHDSGYEAVLDVFKALVIAVPRLPDSPIRAEAARQARQIRRLFDIMPNDVELSYSPVETEPLLTTPTNTIDFSMLYLAEDAGKDWLAWLDRLADEGKFDAAWDVPFSFFKRFGAWVLKRWSDPSTRKSVEAFVTSPHFRIVHSSGSVIQQAEQMAPDAFVNPHVASSVWHRRFQSGQFTPEALAQSWATIAARGIFPPLMIFTRATARQSEVLRALWSFETADLDFRSSLLRLIHNGQSHRESRLARNGTWARLQLPQPGPVTTSPDPIELDRDAPRPLRIALSGLRGHDDTSIDLTPDSTADGSLLVLVGENGTGKTTLLRGIAFALAADVAGSFVTQSRAPYLRDPTRYAECRLETQRGAFHAQVQRNGPAEQLIEVNAPCRPFVAAYGCRRGSALGSPERASNIGLADFVDNLFDRPSGLTRTETWLNTLKPGRDADPEVVQRFEHVRAQLCAVLPGVSSLDLDDDGSVHITLAADPSRKVLLEAMSDGYLTTLGWVIDLMALWIHWRARVVKQPVPADFCAVMSGYVLLDEVDLHLHPVWQTHVLADVRRLFPRLHFIVTTHNPMTLVGARPGEVRRLTRVADTGALLVEEPPQDPRLKTGGELYENFFGIDRLYPTELGEALREYSYLAGDPDRSDDEEARLQEIIALFQREHVDPGWQPTTRGAEGEST